MILGHGESSIEDLILSSENGSLSVGSTITGYSATKMQIVLMMQNSILRRVSSVESSSARFSSSLLLVLSGY